MPRLNARLIGASKAPLSTTQTPMPAALALMAALKALIISPTSALVDPVQVYATSNALAASAAPYCVGTKNGFVVTWLMRANFHFGCLGNTVASEPSDAPSAASAAISVGTDSAAPPTAMRFSSEARSRPRSSSSSPLRSSSLTASYLLVLGRRCATLTPSWDDVQLLKYRNTDCGYPVGLP